MTDKRLCVISNEVNDLYEEADHRREHWVDNRPELRHKKIMEMLVNKNKLVITLKLELTFEKLLALKVHDEAYLRFLQGVFQSWLKDDQPGDYESMDFRAGLIPTHFHRRLSFQSIHKLPYYRQMGYYCVDADTPIYHGTFDAALRSANNGYQAVERLKEFDLIYCLNTYPGHHAMSNGYGGYCYLNNAAIIVARFLQLLPKNRVLILDLDYHHGDGTQEIFYQQNNVRTISIHADPGYEYPSYSGFTHEMGEGEGKGHNQNIPLEAGIGLTEYLEMLNDVVNPAIKDFKPDLLIIALGVDGLTKDPGASNNGGWNLTVGDYYEIGKNLSQHPQKKIITQEGGYDMNRVPTAVNNFLDGISGKYQ